jgi:hypothetical protein
VSFAGFWSAVWPNLAADVIWVPCVWLWHHTRLDRKLEAQRETIVREIREHFEKENEE